MTTSQHFFLKLFDKNEKAKIYYKDLNFNQFSSQELKFLQNLSILSKYKDYIKKFFETMRVKNDEKRNYILSYKSLLSYEEYIYYDSSVDMLEQKKLDALYILGYGSKLLYLIYFSIGFLHTI